MLFNENQISVKSTLQDHILRLSIRKYAYWKTIRFWVISCPFFFFMIHLYKNICLKLWFNFHYNKNYIFTLEELSSWYIVLFGSKLKLCKRRLSPVPLTVLYQWENGQPFLIVWGWWSIFSGLFSALWRWTHFVTKEWWSLLKQWPTLTPVSSVSTAMQW